MPPGTVAVLGGGVAGLSAAHELVERGFAVTVYESSRALRRQGAQLRRARIGDRRAPRPAGRARLPLLPGLLPPPARHHEADPRPAGRPPRLRRAGGRRPDDARARERRQRAHHRRARAGLARRLRRRRAVHVHRLHGAGDLGRGPGLLRRPAAGAADELRRAPLRAVGEAVVVAVRRRRAPLAGLPPLPGRRPHAHARRRAGAGDQRAHRRLHPAAADLRPLARGRPRRPPARRADQRGVDRPVGRAPARRRGRPADRQRGRRDRLRRTGGSPG